MLGRRFYVCQLQHPFAGLCSFRWMYANRIHKEKNSWTVFFLFFLFFLYSINLALLPAKTKYSDQNISRGGNGRSFSEREKDLHSNTYTSKFTLEFVFIMKNESSKVLFSSFFSKAIFLFIFLPFSVFEVHCWENGRTKFWGVTRSSINRNTGKGALPFFTFVLFSIVACSQVFCSDKKIFLKADFIFFWLLSINFNCKSVDLLYWVFYFEFSEHFLFYYLSS